VNVSRPASLKRVHAVATSSLDATWIPKWLAFTPVRGASTIERFSDGVRDSNFA
jgi:hypothetical protein